MKSPSVQPIYLSGLGLIIAPLACGANVTLTALFTRQIEVRQSPATFLGVTFLALLVCFPLGLLSEHVAHLWNSGEFKKSRILSARSANKFAERHF